MTTGPRRGVLRFTVDSRHVRQLGQELVEDSVTALSELIKNAYDADATQVDLIFREAGKQAGGELEIRDDGIGMALKDIQEGWMRISTDYKDRHPLSPQFKRIRSGMKGIGR